MLAHQRRLQGWLFKGFIYLFQMEASGRPLVCKSWAGRGVACEQQQWKARITTVEVSGCFLTFRIGSLSLERFTLVPVFHSFYSRTSTVLSLSFSRVSPLSLVYPPILSPSLEPHSQQISTWPRHFNSSLALCFLMISVQTAGDTLAPRSTLALPSGRRANCSRRGHRVDAILHQCNHTCYICSCLTRCALKTVVLHANHDIFVTHKETL